MLPFMATLEILVKGTLLLKILDNVLRTTDTHAWAIPEGLPLA